MLLILLYTNFFSNKIYFYLLQLCMYMYIAKKFSFAANLVLQNLFLLSAKLFFSIFLLNFFFICFKKHAFLWSKNCYKSSWVSVTLTFCNKAYIWIKTSKFFKFLFCFISLLYNLKPVNFIGESSYWIQLFFFHPLVKTRQSWKP